MTMKKETQCSHSGKCPRNLPKRRRPLVSAILFFAASSSAFTSIPSIARRSTVPLGQAQSPSLIVAAATPPSQLTTFDTKKQSTASSSSTTSPDHHQQQQHLSNTEQRKLLDQVIEMRRIQQLKRTSPLLLHWSRAAGYGDDVWSMEDAIAAGEAAREQLITSNMGLVRYVVKGITTKRRRHLQSLTYEDLCQEGVLGLVRAMDRWDPTVRTAKFSTYAVYWIRAVVLRYIAEKDSVIRVPCYVSSTVSKVTRAARTMGWTNDEDWAWREAADAKALAEAAGVSDKQLQEAIKVKNRKILSFDTWAEIEKATVCDVENEELDMRDSSHTKQALSKFLGPKEVEAISWRYGLNDSDAVGAFSGGRWGEAMSFAQVGEQMKVSAEYGRRLCNRAMDKLRAAAEDGSLQPAFLSM